MSDWTPTKPAAAGRGAAARRAGGMTPACRLFVGGHSWTIAGEPVDLGGDRCFTAVHPAPAHTDTSALRYLLDSGAFSDVRQDSRLTPDAALDRQLAWEAQASDVWGQPVMAEAVVSYDRLIDEVWTPAGRVKRRWSVAEAESAVTETIDAAAYLASQRSSLAPRRLVLSCQGVSAGQYAECAAEVIRHAQPGDWLGFGGWCILGRWQSWLGVFVETCQRVLPLMALAGLTHCHVFGVLWRDALGALVWLADQYGITVSCDSTAPLLAAAAKNHTKSGARMPYWRDNVAWWVNELANLRASRFYRAPARQASLWEAVA